MSNKKIIENPMPMRRHGGGPGGHGHFQERATLKDGKRTIGRIWAYLTQQKVLLIVAILFIFIHSTSVLIASYQVRPIINGIATHAGVSVLIKNLIQMALIYCVAVFSSYIHSRIMLEISQKALARLRTDLFSKIQKLPLKFFDNVSNGDIMSRFTNDVDAISQMLSTTCVQIISSIVSVATTIILMLYTNWVLSLVVFTIVPIVTFVTKAISKRSIVYYKKQQQTMGDLNGYIEEMISGQKVVKVFNHEEEAIENFKKVNAAYRDNAAKAQFLGGIMGPIMGSLNSVSYILTAGVGGLLCLLRGFDIGGFTIFLNYSRNFSRPLTEIFMQINTVFSALAGAERVFEVMDEKTEVQDVDDAVTLNSIRGEIVLKNVVFGYVDTLPVLKGISLAVKPSQKIALVGSTGAGKTTITNMLNRFYDIQGGSITIDGIDLQRIKKESLRQNIAMVLQDTHLFTGTVMENIRYGRLDASDDEVIEAAKVANADRFIRQLENGYNTILTGDGQSLSQGQRQLLNIARAAISKAPILVLDEATSSVDTKTERHIEQALDRLMKSRTTFVVAHRLSTVRNADRIVVLEDGNIIEQGSHDELLLRKGRYYDLHAGSIELD